MILAKAGTPPPPAGTYYQVIAKHSGKCLDVSAASLVNGANVQQWACNGGDNQRWKLVSMGDGYNELVAKHSGKCADVSTALHRGARSTGKAAPTWRTGAEPLPS